MNCEIVDAAPICDISERKHDDPHCGLGRVISSPVRRDSQALRAVTKYVADEIYR